MDKMESMALSTMSTTYSSLLPRFPILMYSDSEFSMLFILGQWDLCSTITQQQSQPLLENPHSDENNNAILLNASIRCHLSLVGSTIRLPCVTFPMSTQESSHEPRSRGSHSFGLQNSFGLKRVMNNIWCMKLMMVGPFELFPIPGSLFFSVCELWRWTHLQVRKESTTLRFHALLQSLNLIYFPNLWN